MKNGMKSIISLLLCLIIAFSVSIIAFAEADTNESDISTETVPEISTTSKVEETISAVVNNPTELICISKLGDTVNYPENSAEGILAAAESGADMVLVSVRKTEDDVIVLFTDSNLSRMCVDKEGNTVDKEIKNVKFDELQTYFLRNGSGNNHEKMTAYSVPSLKQTLESLNKRVVLLLDGGWEYRNDIYDLLVECNALDYVAFVTDAKKSTVAKWKASKPAAPLVVTEYNGTVIWNSRSYIKKSANINALGVILSCQNAYSTTFSKSTVKKTAGKTRAVIDMTDAKKCGKRLDTAVYWDDVTLRGFSMIITNNIEQFIDYRSRVDTSRKTLENLIVRVNEVDLTLCSTSSANALKQSLEDADKIAKTSVSAMEIDNAYNDLYKSFNNLQNKTDKDKGSSTITGGRIVAAIVVVIAIVFMEIAFEVLRNKSIALRKVGKKLFFSKDKKRKKKKNTINFD